MIYLKRVKSDVLWIGEFKTMNSIMQNMKHFKEGKIYLSLFLL